MEANAEQQNPAAAKQNTSQTNTIDEPVTGWQFNAETQTNNNASSPESSPQSSAAANESMEPVTWTASEYIAHQKSFSWYLALALVTAALASGIYFLTKDTVSVVVIIVVALIFGVYAARKPRVLGYQLDESGLVIGGKTYAYDLFKSFALVQEGPFTSIMLMPLKRFMPAVSLYFEPNDENKIETMLSNFLPVEARKLDAIDNLMRKIRF